MNDTTPAQQVAPLDDDLEHTRKLRRNIVDSCFDEKGRMIGEDDPDKRAFVLKALDSIDKSAIARKRIHVGEGANDIARMTSGFLSELHLSTRPDPFKVDNPVARSIEPDLGDVLLTEFDLNPHMLSQELDSGKTNYDDFNTTFLKENPEYDD